MLTQNVPAIPTQENNKYDLKPLPYTICMSMKQLHSEPCVLKHSPLIVLLTGCPTVNPPAETLTTNIFSLLRMFSVAIRKDKNHSIRTI